MCVFQAPSSLLPARLQQAPHRSHLVNSPRDFLLTQVALQTAAPAANLILLNSQTAQASLEGPGQLLSFAEISASDFLLSRHLVEGGRQKLIKPVNPKEKRSLKFHLREIAPGSMRATQNGPPLPLLPHIACALSLHSLHCE